MQLCYLPPSAFLETYFNCGKQLIYDVSKIKNIEDKRKLFEKFVQKFTTVSEIWKLWQIYEEYHLSETQISRSLVKAQVFKKLNRKSMDHFLFENRFGDDYTHRANQRISLEEIFSFSLHYFQKSLGIKEMNFKFEDDFFWSIQNEFYESFETFWDLVKEFSTTTIPNNIKDKVAASFEYYRGLDQTLGSHDEWMKAVLKNENRHRVIQNIERYLKGYSFERKLWKFYIEYLEKEKLMKNILKVYSRYCRLFVNDEAMRMKYYNEIIKFHKMGENVAAKKWLLDLAKIKNDFESTLNAVKFMKKVLTELYGSSDLELNENDFMTSLTMFKQSINYAEIEISNEMQIPKASKTHIKFINLSSKVNQTFTLPQTLLYFLIKNPAALMKLNKTCKYFPSTHKIIPVHKLSLTLTDAPQCYQESIFLNMEKIQNENLPKFYVCNSLCVNNVDIRHCVKELRPKLYKCDIKYLHIWYQNLSMEDFKFITSSGNVEKIYMLGSVILESNETLIANLKDVMACLPNAKSLRFEDGGHTPAMPMKSLSSITHKTKITHFLYYGITEIFDPYDFYNFVMENAEDGSYLRCRYRFNLDRNVRKSIDDAINKMKVQNGRKILIIFQ